MPGVHQKFIHTLREKHLYLEFFWSVFSHIRTEYEEIRSNTPYSVQMREDMDQKHSEYEKFSRSDTYCVQLQICMTL